MKKGLCYEGIVEETIFPAKGVVKVEGEEKKVIVKNTIPGQKILFRITKKKGGKFEGTLQEVLEKAPNEVESLCPHFTQCGGCNYQNLSYDDQVLLKKNQIKSILDKVYTNRGEEPRYIYDGIKQSPIQYAYRNKMEFSFGDLYKDGPLALGLHKRGGFYDIVSVTDCQIVDEDYRNILKTSLDFFTEKQVSFYHRMRQVGYLRHLLVRKATKTGEILIGLITSTEEDANEKVLLEQYVTTILSLEQTGKLCGTIKGIIHTTNSSVADVVKEDASEILYGQDHFYEELLGLKFKISQFSFFQTNSLGAECLYQTVRDYIGNIENQPVVFDLYSGTGTIAQLIAPVASKVIGVEIVEEAVEAAKQNATLNGLSNCEFIAGDVLKVIDEISEKPDLIILDPPRDGIHPKALPKIIAYGVDRIVYISCKPTSLARDLEVFFDNGYVMEKACAVDMFPGTGHCESVVLLQRQ